MRPAITSARTSRRQQLRPESREQGAAMVTALIAIMLTATMSILMLGVITSQVMPTSFLRASSQTIFAAEAGVNAVLGQIRTAEGAANFGVIYGDTTLLPCTASGPVDGSGTTLRYEATVQYFTEDPTGRSAAWIAANAVGCVAGSGPVVDPTYALLTSTGVGEDVVGLSADAGDRVVSAVYEFQVTNNNIPGGLIYNFDADVNKSGKYCLQADNAIAGAFVRYVPAVDCGTDDSRQLWIYSNSYQIKLASTTLPSLYPAGPLCIEGPTTPSAALPQRVILQQCEPPTAAARWNQLFSWEGGANFRGELSTITNYSDIVLSTGSASVTSGSYLQAWDQDGDRQEWVSFTPDPRVGAGAAGYNTHQIVNYLEFGRCFDVTDEDVDSLFMIAYPCKQDPSPGGTLLFWNHKWFYTEPAGAIGSLGPQQIYVRQYNDDARKYCLVSPGTDGGYVTLDPCSGSAASQRWTRNADTGDYATSYTLVDSSGRCASLGGLFDTWSKITTATCNAGLGQKWNAPASTISASVGGYQELH